MRATVEQLWDFFEWLDRHPNHNDIINLTDESLEIDAYITKSLLEEYARAKEDDVP